MGDSALREQEIVSYARYLLPAAVLARLEKEFPRRQLKDEEKGRYERDAEEGSDGEGMPRGLMVLCWRWWGRRWRRLGRLLRGGDE